LTFGKGLTTKATEGLCAKYYNHSYPQELQQMLDDMHPHRTWDVKNLGVQGASVKDWLQALGAQVKKTTPLKSYSLPGPEIKSALAAGCDVIIVMLGTNDALKVSWNEQEFTSDFTQLVRKLQTDFPPAPILLSIPTPIIPGGSFAQHFDADAINRALPRVIPQIAAGLGLVCIDTFNAMGPNAICKDGVHIEPTSYKTLASILLDPALRSIPGPTAAVAAVAAVAAEEKEEDDIGLEEVDVEESSEEEGAKTFFCLPRLPGSPSRASRAGPARAQSQRTKKESSEEEEEEDEDDEEEEVYCI
jgi:lysophospholipase L1-like esterase